MTEDKPCARRDHLVVQPLDGELLAYDTESDQASVLNPTAAAIWQECNGKRSAAEIAARVSKRLAAPVDAKLVWYTLRELSNKNLLAERVILPAEFQRLTRRDFIRRAGLVGASVALPVIASIAAPKIADAASCISSGSKCTLGGDCCSKICNDGICM